jgi:hypothetical protein
VPLGILLGKRLQDQKPADKDTELSYDDMPPVWPSEDTIGSLLKAATSDDVIRHNSPAWFPD